MTHDFITIYVLVFEKYFEYFNYSLQIVTYLLNVNIF